jgi:hypothetical protein
MSFREKSAWITLVSVAVCFGVYFSSIAAGGVGPRGFGAFHFLLLCVAALVVLQIGAHFIAAAFAPKDARAPRDERERLIAWRAQSLGYYVLMVGVLGLGVPGHLGRPVPDLLNFALLVVVAAALVVAVAQIVMYRRGA